MPFITHAAMRKLILNKSPLHKEVEMLGLDIGRRSVGFAITTQRLTKALPLINITIDPQLHSKIYSFEKHVELYRRIKDVITNKHIKGIAACYPLDLNNNETEHCKFVKSMVKHVMNTQMIAIPFTLVKETESVKEDSRVIMDLYSGKDATPIGSDKIACKMLKKYLKFLHSTQQAMDE